MSKLYFEDRNYPFCVYVVPSELKKLFKDYMRGEGAALAEYKNKRFDNRYTFTYVSLKDENKYNPFSFQERTPNPSDYFGVPCGASALHCETCRNFLECPAFIEYELCTYATDNGWE